MRLFRPISPPARALAAVAAASTALILPAASQGSGLFVARFGGDHGHAATDNPSAIYYNPAGLALGKGSRLLVDATLAHRTASYDRPAAAITNPGTGTPADGAAANSGEATLTNQAASPFLGFATDLGIEDLGLGLAFFVPIGGAAVWDGNDAFKGGSYPGAQDGVTRWWAMEGSMTSLYLALGGAYRLAGTGLSLGVAVNGVSTKVHTIRARNGDGTDDLVDGAGGLKEGRTELKASGLDLSLGLGVVYEAGDNTRIGLSFQTRPGLSGEQTLEGDLRQALGVAPVNTSKIELIQGLADVARVGVRHRIGASWEVRVAAEYAFWSAMQRQCILDTAFEKRKCDVADDGSAPSSNGFIANLERRWQDAFGGRVGVSHFLNDRLEILAGAGYDGTAVPDDFMDPALFDLVKYTATLGAVYGVMDDIDVSGTFTQVVYAQADTGRAAPPDLSPPSKGPDSGGVYNQAISVLNIGVLTRF